jgi:uncharacterized phage protein (TIGR01671 family)
MREIKFRGKNPDGYWIEGDLVRKALTAHAMIVDCGIAEEGCYPIGVIPETVGQYTGLRDKNGKEIYEGDIVKYRDISYGDFNTAISWNETMGAFCAYDFDFPPKQIDIPEREWGKSHNPCNCDGAYFSLRKSPLGSIGNIDKLMHLEIIGNIHENPELLK